MSERKRETRKREPVFRGLVSLTDSVMAPLLFLLHVFFITLPGGDSDSVRTFGYLTGQSGESLTIPCFYDRKYKDHVKYWCRGSLWSSCKTMARTDSPEGSRKVSITDKPAQLVFNVIMWNLRTRNTGIYWCAVEIGGIGEMDDFQSLLIEVKDARSVRTVSWESAERGGSVTIPCYYDQKYKDHVKYWCKGRDWNSCSTLARSDSNQTAGKVSVSDDPTHLVFNVTMRNLQETDSDTYWCAVDIHRAADDGVYLQLIVMEAMGVSPKQGEPTTALQQTETFTSSTQQRDNLTSATKHPTGWAVTTCPSGVLTSNNNENLNTTQSPSQVILLLTPVLLLFLLATVMIIWILRRRTKTLISNRNTPSRPTTKSGDELVYGTVVFMKPSAQIPSVDPRDEVTYSSVIYRKDRNVPPFDVTSAAVVSKKDRIS
ncbi:CMRF35-like molecule 8 [Brienomyrus brachyistius]|uniref:CMRF35-like molecule 8 n=1 Tax=Brienomyrus brachyistius TaxID=42636 RepID=UPI0020B3A9E1|nr:CMRF35-like molecule 8 [Brienomyrus brachyistius]